MTLILMELSTFLERGLRATAPYSDPQYFSVSTHASYQSLYASDVIATILISLAQAPFLKTA